MLGLLEGTSTVVSRKMREHGESFTTSDCLLADNVERKQSDSNTLNTTSLAVKFAPQICVRSYSERHLDICLTNQTMTKGSSLMVSKSFRDKLARCLKNGGSALGRSGQPTSTAMTPDALSHEPTKQVAIQSSTNSLSAEPNSSLAVQQLLSTNVSNSVNGTIAALDCISSSRSSKTAMQASLNMIKSGVPKPLRQIHIVGQLNHSTNHGFLFLVGCIVLALAVLVTFTPLGRIQLIEASLVGWPFSKISPTVSVARSPAYKQRIVRSQTSSEPPISSNHLASAAVGPPMSKQFHYFWNHDKIEPKQMAEEAEKILNAAQVQTNRLVLDGLPNRELANGPSERIDASKSLAPSVSGDPMASSSSDSKPVIAESLPVGLPPAIQQQLTHLVLQLQRQQQMSMLMQPQFPSAPPDMALASRRASQPIASVFAPPYNPMSRYWTSASSQHPVLAPPPLMMSPSETLNFAQHSRPIGGAATIAGVPVFGPFAINPTIRLPLAHGHQSQQVQAHSRASDTHQKPTGLTEVSRLPLLSRRRNWPLFGLGAANHFLQTSSSQVRPTVVQPPVHVPSREVSPAQVTLSLTPESIAMLDAASDQLANAIAGQLQLQSVQHKLASALSKALNPHQVRGTDLLQAASSNSVAQRELPAQGLHIGQKPTDIQPEIPIPPYLLSNLLHPAHLGLSIAHSLFGPQNLAANSNHPNDNSTGAIYGNRLKRRQLSNSPGVTKTPLASQTTDNTNLSQKLNSREERYLKFNVSSSPRAAKRIVKKDLVRKSKSHGKQVVELADTTGTDLDSPVRRLKRSIKSSGSTTGWRSLESPAVDIQKRQADLSNSSSSSHDDQLSDRQDRSFKVKKLTASASVLHQVSSHRPALVRGQIVSGSAVRVANGKDDSESVSINSDPMSSSVSESARVNYFQNVEKEAQASQTASTSSTSQNQAPQPVTSVPMIPQTSPVSVMKQQSQSSSSSPMINVGFPAPIQTGARSYSFLSGSNNTRTSDYQDTKRPSNQAQALNQGTSSNFPKGSLATSSQHNIMAHRQTQPPQSVTASSQDISSAATGGNYAFANSGNLGQQVSSLASGSPVLNLVKAGLRQLGATSSVSLDSQRNLLNSMLALNSLQVKSTSGLNQPKSISSNSNLQQTSVSPQNSHSNGLTGFDLANQGSSYNEPIPVSQEALIPSNRQEAQNERSQQYASNMEAGAAIQDQSGPGEIPMDQDGQFGMKNSVSHEAGSVDGVNLDLNKYSQQSTSQQPSPLSVNEETRPESGSQMAGKNQPDIASESPDSSLYSSNNLNSLANTGSELNILNGVSNQVPYNDPSGGLSQNHQSIRSHQQLFSTGQLYPSAQMQALTSAVMSNYNQQRYNSQLDELGLRGSSSVHHFRPSQQVYPQTLEQAIRQRNHLHNPPGGYYTVDDDAGITSSITGGVSGYPSTAQMIAFQQGRGNLNDLNSMLMSGSENRETGEEKVNGGKGPLKKGKKKDFKQISHHYHFNSFNSPFEDPESQFAPINPLDIAGSQLANQEHQQQLKQQQQSKPKNNKDEEKQETDEEEEKPKKKRFLRRFSIKNLIKKLRKDKKKENANDESKENNEQPSSE